MSDEQTNGSETNVRRAFRAKLSPGPEEEVIVLADDAVRAVELLGEKFDWKNIELSRIDEAQLIGDATKGEEKHIEECNRLRNRNIARGKKIEQLNAILLLCQRAAVGEQTEFEQCALANSNALQAIVERVQRYGEISRANVGLRRTSAQAEQEIEKLRKEGERLAKERDCLKEDLEAIRQVATGEAVAGRVEMGSRPSLDAVVDLRQKFESFKTTAFKPAPPGPVPSRPPRPGEIDVEMERQAKEAADEKGDDESDETAPPPGMEVLQHIVDHVEPDTVEAEPPVETFPAVEQPSPDDATVVRPLMSEQIGTVPSDFGTADATKMPGPGKPAKVIGTGDAEEST